MSIICLYHDLQLFTLHNFIYLIFAQEKTIIVYFEGIVKRLKTFCTCTLKSLHEPCVYSFLLINIAVFARPSRCRSVYIVCYIVSALL